MLKPRNWPIFKITPGNPNLSYIIDIENLKKMFSVNYCLKLLIWLAYSPKVADIGEIGNELKILSACSSHMNHFR